MTAPAAELAIQDLAAAGRDAKLRIRRENAWTAHVHIVVDDYEVALSLDPGWPWFEHSVLQAIDMCLRKPNPNASNATCECFSHDPLRG